MTGLPFVRFQSPTRDERGNFTGFSDDAEVERGAAAWFKVTARVSID